MRKTSSPSHPETPEITVIAAFPSPQQHDRCLLHCADPYGQIIHLTLGVFWVFGRPEPDTAQAEVNGDAVLGAEVVTRHAGQLRAALAVAYRDAVGPCQAAGTHGGRAVA